ncbi:MAG: hypothetical protein HN802_04830 [Candidatus Jacksonbacteria bacterium]|jgi:hypothetical protein|nr:hypothetical protein [Candidatus Jacksonbacteria bacterium]
MVKEMQAAVRSSIEKTSIEVFNEVAARTPVDTGNARISWNISTGSPNFSTRSTGVTPTGNWSAESTPPTDPVVLANDFLLESHLDRVYIANGVPYIGVLELGHSAQAPIGMVAATLARDFNHVLQGNLKEI